jgi:hypothetical protein
MHSWLSNKHSAESIYLDPCIAAAIDVFGGALPTCVRESIGATAADAALSATAATSSESLVPLAIQDDADSTASTSKELSTTNNDEEAGLLYKESLVITGVKLVCTDSDAEALVAVKETVAQCRRKKFQEKTSIQLVAASAASMLTAVARYEDSHAVARKTTDEAGPAGGKGVLVPADDGAASNTGGNRVCTTTQSVLPTTAVDSKDNRMNSDGTDAGTGATDADAFKSTAAIEKVAFPADNTWSKEQPQGCGAADFGATATGARSGGDSGGSSSRSDTRNATIADASASVRDADGLDGDDAEIQSQASFAAIPLDVTTEMNFTCPKCKRVFVGSWAACQQHMQTRKHGKRLVQ